MNLMEEVSKLQERLVVAQRERTRAEGAYETAKAVADRARQDLLRDFDVDNVADAERLMQTLRQELTELVVQLNAELDRIGVA